MFPPCVDHDLFEGIFPSIFKFSVKYFVSKKMFNIKSIEKSFNSLELRHKDKTNFPLINFERIDHIRFIASESHCLSRFYLMLLDEIPEDDEVLKLLRLLISITQILMRHEFNSDQLLVLNNLIYCFLMHCSKFSEIKITVKFHHLIHYPRLIEKFGPPKIFSTINFESIHSLLKQKISNSKNWRNVVLTTLKKYARSSSVSAPPRILEIGASSFILQLPSIILNAFSPDTEFTVLRGLNILNQHFRCGTTAIVFENSINNLILIKIEIIFKANEQYFAYGVTYHTYEDCANRFFLLESSQRHLIRVDYSTIAYEIYSKENRLFVVPYFCLR